MKIFSTIYCQVLLKTIFITKQLAKMQETAYLTFQILEIFWGGMPPDPPVSGTRFSRRLLCFVVSSIPKLIENPVILRTP